MKALRESAATELIRDGLSFLMCVEVSIMWFNSSALELDFTA